MSLTTGCDNQKAENDYASEEEQDETDMPTTLDLTLQKALCEDYEMYHDLASKRRGLKIERKRKAAIEAAIDPNCSAKRRQRK